MEGLVMFMKKCKCQLIDRIENAREEVNEKNEEYMNYFRKYLKELKYDKR